jgi:hypothetical protein
MNDAKSADDVADQAAEAIRKLNHQLLGGGLEYPADCYDLIGSLHALAARLPQALGLVATWLEREQAAGNLGHVSGDDAGQYALAAAEALRRAGDDATVMAEALETAHAASGGIKMTEG